MKPIIHTILFSSATVFITFCLIKFPDQTLEASIRGLNLWWEVVFPSLLPFFIISELLIAFGVVKFIGRLFEPVMRPLFNVPGVGSFGMIMGMVSGYPTGAKIAARLREEKQLTQVEAERLVSFTNNSSPLFIFGAISAGFFHDAKLGILLATSHYLGNAMVGICMRFHGRQYETTYKKHARRFSVKQAFWEMHEARIKANRPVGEILGDAVINSIKTLVMIGGFIVLFSVIIKLLFLVGVSSMISSIFAFIFSIISLPESFALPFISGLFEITIGANMISQITSSPLLQQAIFVSFILGFNGFSVQAQVASILAKTDIRFLPYFISRLLHGTIASILTIILFQPLYLNKQTFELKDIPVYQPIDVEWMGLMEKLQDIGPIITLLALMVAIIILLRRNVKNGGVK
ncbi:sporulation integral membrane protein YlbJ [Oceanobacillus piezotolerans]|uniref:Sporulation integral membrane protein YlbJ n=1 Tax=Oceanobacillus piezotolerans TaxID=2448030 RepID=A0A498D9C1_9BACI|nr:sporulation integral membrane protein YlbJ [Oceanobacillus piezotolerans]RLL45221.1 sporulation integral membrane protein YlbJ [Oceanobacillus piezotolerans]